MQLISVVFPEPFGPIRPNRSPGRISTLTLSSAVKPPKRLGKRVDPQQGRVGLQRAVMACLPRADDSASLQIRPMMPSGAPTTNSTSMTPSTSTLTSDEMVTVRSCCVVPSRMAPTTGPIQCAVPPISDIASAETE